MLQPAPSGARARCPRQNPFPRTARNRSTAHQCKFAMQIGKFVLVHQQGIYPYRQSRKGEVAGCVTVSASLPSQKRIDGRDLRARYGRMTLVHHLATDAGRVRSLRCKKGCGEEEKGNNTRPSKHLCAPYSEAGFGENSELGSVAG